MLTQGKKGLWLALTFALLLGCRPLPARPLALPASPSGIVVSLDATTGTYQIVTRTPAWTFAGTLGNGLSDVKHSSGHDALGNYDE